MEKEAIDELCRFIDFLDETIDKEYTVMSISPEDAIRKDSYCLALERVKYSLNNILDGKKFDDDDYNY